MKITILGAGAYAIALTKMFEKNNLDITLWTKFTNEQEMLINKRENTKNFPGVKISKNTKVSTDLKSSLNNCDLLVIALPTAFIRETLNQVRPFFNKNTIVLNASKGIEENSLKLIHQIVSEELKTKKYVNLSGPTIAKDLANNEICSLTIASKDKRILKKVKMALTTDNLSLETSSDVIGTEICGAVKNTIAIASGIIEGLGLSISTKAKFMTDSMNDLKMISYIIGGNKKTINTYAGIGDLYMTCNSITSRNFHLGYLIGSKSSKKKIEEYIKSNTIEGLYTLDPIKELLNNKEVNIKIIENLYDIIYRNYDPLIIVK